MERAGPRRRFGGSALMGWEKTKRRGEERGDDAQVSQVTLTKAGPCGRLDLVPALRMDPVAFWKRKVDWLL